jgi:signal transduction histidine kinase
LSKINFLSEIISQKTVDLPEIRNNSEAVKETSKKMIENMRDLIWALNPDNTTIANLLARMREYSTDYLEDYPIEIQNDFPENPPQTAITKEAHRELFMVVKESLNNIVKHSKASKVYFTAKINPSNLEFSIKDDGEGFDIESIKNGNGLRNMKTRLQSIDGQCNVVSEHTIGTEINVVVSLDKIIKR